MIPFLTEIYGFSYHYTANAPTLQEIFIIFLCRHAPFSAGTTRARPPREASASRGGRARKQTRRLCTPQPQAHSVRHTASAFIETLRPQNQKGPRRGPSALPKEGARRVKPYKAIPRNRRASPSGRPRPIAFSKPFRYRLYPPVCVLFCAITRKICLISRFSDAHRNHRCA